MDKNTVVYLHGGILLGHRKKEILAFAPLWMGLDSIMLSEISQSEKNEYQMISLIEGI